MELTQTEENYLKALYRLTVEHDRQEEVGSTELSTYLDVKPASVNEMLKKLKEKELVSYMKYGKISLTEKGKNNALHIVRKHRIWETFLFRELEYKGNEVHEIAEQLEHIQSPDLIERLFKYLGKPKNDPHGEVIPMVKSECPISNPILLSKVKVDNMYAIHSFKVTGKAFFQYMERLDLHIGDKILVKEMQGFDHSLIVEKKEKSIHITEQVATSILVCKVDRW
ncbi:MULTISPECIES: metal-dependent transcriptional regulator [Chitinophagaceae]